MSLQQSTLICVSFFLELLIFWTRSIYRKDRVLWGNLQVPTQTLASGEIPSSTYWQGFERNRLLATFPFKAVITKSSLTAPRWAMDGCCHATTRATSPDKHCQSAIFFISLYFLPSFSHFFKGCCYWQVAVISAKNHKRQYVTAKREKSQTPKVLTAILTLPNLT